MAAELTIRQYGAAFVYYSDGAAAPGDFVVADMLSALQSEQTMALGLGSPGGE